MGGKSRKSGGVSKKLIQALKSGKGISTCNNGKKNANSNSRNLFDSSAETEDYT